MKLGTESDPNALSGEIRYRVYSETGGWQEWKTDGEYAGKNENDAFVQAFQAELTGDLAQIYDLYYSVHVQQGGWLEYAKNGQQAGTEDSRIGWKLSASCLQKRVMNRQGKIKDIMFRLIREMCCPRRPMSRLMGTSRQWAKENSSEQKGRANG